MAADPISTLDEILKRSGHDVDLRENEVDRYFLFDQISDSADLDLAWSQFPAHDEIRTRAAEIDAISDIVPGFGYRTPKVSNRCSDVELVDCLRKHIAAIYPWILREHYNQDVLEFLNKPFDILVVDANLATPPKATDNVLFLTLYEAINESKLGHFSFEPPINEVLYDWANNLTNCSEVALYLLWPVLDDIANIDPNTPSPGFKLWSYNCRSRYWIKDGNLESGVVFIQPPWLTKDVA